MSKVKKRAKPKVDFERRITTWIGRLHELYGEIQDWMREHPDWVSTLTETPQRREEILERAKIAPRFVPVLTLVKGRTTVQFVPNALWVIGANGRVDIASRNRVYILVDRAEDDAAARDWQIVIPENRKILLPFDRAALSLLLSGQ